MVYPKCSCDIFRVDNTFQPHVCPGRDLLRLSIRALSTPLSERWRRRLKGHITFRFRSFSDILSDTTPLDTSSRRYLDMSDRVYHSTLRLPLFRHLRHVQVLRQIRKTMCKDQYQYPSCYPIPLRNHRSAPDRYQYLVLSLLDCRRHLHPGYISELRFTHHNISRCQMCGRHPSFVYRNIYPRLRVLNMSHNISNTVHLLLRTVHRRRLLTQQPHHVKVRQSSRKSSTVYRPFLHHLQI